MKFRASKISNYKLLLTRSNCGRPVYPLLKDNNGELFMTGISPTHGRSFVLKKNNESDWVVGKGNGLCYSTYNSLINSSFDSDTWGMLSIEHATRDFNISNEVSSLGIKTNKMEYVMELPFDIVFHGRKTRAALLQYSVECPYRISDYGFIPLKLLNQKVKKWNKIVSSSSKFKHLIAADILFHNLKILHSNGILHNAITPQNYTWSLELLDFEASHTPRIPYGNKEYQSFIPMIMDMEILKTYEIINMIAWILNETPKYKEIEAIIRTNGFQLINSI